MRKLRRQSREEVKVSEFINSEESLKEITKTEKSELPKTSTNNIVTIMKMGVTANELKLLEAIEIESRETEESIPPMSTNYISSKYSINHKYLGDAIKGLIEKGLIKRHPSKFRGQKSFSWEIVKQ
jgi:hypothetical protein